MRLCLRRREFIAGLGGAAAWPIAARAQQPAKKPPTIGILGSGTPSTLGPRIAVMVQRLREIGWIENQTVRIEYRWAEGRSERATEIAAEFVRLGVDVIVTSGTTNVIAAKQATSDIPIVFANVSDPLGSGLVASLAQPGGNVTGLSGQQPDAAGKRLALLREVVPALQRVGFMGNTDNPSILLEMQEVQTAAGMLGIDCATFQIRRAGDIAPAFDAVRHGAQGLYLAGDPLTDVNRLRISILALGARLPTIWPAMETADFAGLMSYGSNFAAQWRRAGDLVDKILRGTKPVDIPVEQPVKFDLVVNLIVAKALGIEIPTALLARADEVIE